MTHRISTATALAAKDAELAVQREAKEHARRLCDCAEAELAEARKALDKIIAEDRAIVGSGKSRVESDGIYAAIARRALTGGE